MYKSKSYYIILPRMIRIFMNFNGKYRHQNCWNFPFSRIRLNLKMKIVRNINLAFSFGNEFIFRKI